MAAARRAAPVVDVAALLSKARATLENDGVVKLTSLGPKAVRSSVTEELRVLGFEATKSLVRRPLAVQLTEALSQGAFIPLKSIASFVSGGTASESKAAAAKLVQDGLASKVLRGKAEVLVPGRIPVLARDEVVAARRVFESLGKMLAKAVKARGITMLRADLIEAIQEVLPDLKSEPTRALVRRTDGDGHGDALEKVLLALDATRDEEVGLSFIPVVVNHLRGELGADTVRDVLLDASGKGLIELRPEGGLNRLTRDELEVCLPGPQGTRLSWVRRVEERTL